MTETRSPQRTRSSRTPASNPPPAADDFAARNQALLERIALLRRQAAEDKPAEKGAKATATTAKAPKKPARATRGKAKEASEPATARSRVEARRQAKQGDKTAAKPVAQTTTPAAAKPAPRKIQPPARPAKEAASRAVPSRRLAETGRTAAHSKKAELRPATRRHHLTTPEAPPVLVRRDWAAIPLQERSANRTRRRMDVSLNVPGAELRFPALPDIRLNWRLASGMLALLMLALLFHLWYADAYRVQAVEVVGLERLNSNDLATVMGILGEPVFAVDPGRARQELQQAFPQLKSVSVRVSLPNQVKVVVTERQPILGWAQENQLLWVDAEGVAFVPRGEAGTLVMVDAGHAPAGNGKVGDSSAPLVDPGLVTTLQNMAARAPEGATLTYSADYGLGWNDPHGWQVYFGMELSNLDGKLLVYQAMVQKFETEGIQPKIVSLENIHAPYYRLETSSRR